MHTKKGIVRTQGASIPPRRWARHEENLSLAIWRMHLYSIWSTYSTLQRHFQTPTVYLLAVVFTHMRSWSASRTYRFTGQLGEIFMQKLVHNVLESGGEQAKVASTDHQSIAGWGPRFGSEKVVRCRTGSPIAIKSSFQPYARPTIEPPTTIKGAYEWI
jgi:hypothetical protein